MMFDPDYPYKELSETLRENYDSDYLLFNNDEVSTDTITNIDKELTNITDPIISNTVDQSSYEANKCISTGEASFLDISSNIEQNSGLYIINDNLLNYEPVLLDDNTVNQFLLPLQVSSDENQDKTDTGPDLLALHSCVICHEIFTNEADLLDHTISFHASVPDSVTNEKQSSPLSNIKKSTQESTDSTNLDFDTDWLVCGVCERVLSTVLEVEPTEQLCCTGSDGKSNVSPRRLHTMYVCDFCNGLFADVLAIDRHRLSCYNQDQGSFYPEQMNAKASSPDFPQTCACNTQFSTRDELEMHIAGCPQSLKLNVKKDRRAYSSNNSSKMWNCGSCNQLFATARELYRHKRGEDRPAGAPLMAYVCEECDKVLGSMCALHTHKKMHKVSKPGYPCRVCGRRFNQSGHLAIHMRMHTGERPYPCDLCPKAFKVKVERDDHRRTHTGERPFACAACPKTFTAAARLREHARIHTDQRPYRCEICGAAFRRPYARTVHTLIHTGEKPHECDVCHTTFRRSGDMWKHKRTLHGIQAGGEAELKT